MPKTFGEILKMARITQGLKEKQVAEAIQISQAVYSKIENNKLKKIDPEWVRKICIFLKIDANQLFNINLAEDYPNEKNYYWDNRYKKQLKQLEICNEEARKLENEVLNEELKKLEIKQEDTKFIIQYEEREIIVDKIGFSKTIALSLCYTITVFISIMLEKIKNETQKEFSPELVHLYVQYEELLKDIFNL